MQWDLELSGLAVLAVMSIALGAIGWFLFRGRHGWWPAIIATVGFFVVGLLVSEGMFGWATEAELQPNIGGLSFDESLLAFMLGVVAVVAARYLDGRTAGHAPRH